jgi:hypothetical protein
MFRIQKISSFDLPELQPYATMRRPLEHEGQGIFVAEGTKVVRRLLESRFAVVSVVLPEKWLEDFRPLQPAAPKGSEVTEVPLASHLVAGICITQLEGPVTNRFGAHLAR